LAIPSNSWQAIGHPNGTVICLDTHVVVWLAAGEVNRLSTLARQFINSDELLISPIVLLELEYLHEIGRVRVSAQKLFELLSREIGLALCKQDYADVVKAALRQKWTRDPFDRLIVAEAAVADVRLLSKDERILSNYAKAIWE
jgi:PIN domain nuclease of toxin-antitoxin system